VEAEERVRPVADAGRRVEAEAGALPAVLLAAVAGPGVASRRRVEQAEEREPARGIRILPDPGRARSLQGGKLVFYLFSWFVFFFVSLSAPMRNPLAGFYSTTIYQGGSVKHLR
jgi:hypothetical protein